jgi:hypothetical protein
MTAENGTDLALFQGRRIRKTFHEGEWWFSVIDVIEVLVGDSRPRKYWNDLKKKLTAEGYLEVSEKIGQLRTAERWPDGHARTSSARPASPWFLRRTTNAWRVGSRGGWGVAMIDLVLFGRIP